MRCDFSEYSKSMGTGPRRSAGRSPCDRSRAPVYDAGPSSCRTSPMPIMSHIQAKEPCSFVARLAFTKPAIAWRASAPPTLIRLAPASERCAGVMSASSQRVTTLSGLLGPEAADRVGHVHAPADQVLRPCTGYLGRAREGAAGATHG